MRAPVPHVTSRNRWCWVDDWFAALCRFTRRYGIR